MPLVAVVDDEESVRTALARVLRTCGFEVVVYAGGREFLESLSCQRPDCVVMDFHMPGMSGRDVQRELLRSGQRLPLILVTAHDQPTLRATVLADGAAGYLTKPLRGETLAKAIAEAIKAEAATRVPVAGAVYTDAVGGAGGANDSGCVDLRPG